MASARCQSGHELCDAVPGGAAATPGSSGFDTCCTVVWAAYVAPAALCSDVYGEGVEACLAFGMIAASKPTDTVRQPAARMGGWQGRQTLAQHCPSLIGHATRYAMHSADVVPAVGQLAWAQTAPLRNLKINIFVCTAQYCIEYGHWPSTSQYTDSTARQLPRLCHRFQHTALWNSGTKRVCHRARPHGTWRPCGQDGTAALPATLHGSHRSLQACRAIEACWCPMPCSTQQLHVRYPARALCRPTARNQSPPNRIGMAHACMHPRNAGCCVARGHIPGPPAAAQNCAHAAIPTRHIAPNTYLDVRHSGYTQHSAPAAAKAKGGRRAGRPPAWRLQEKNGAHRTRWVRPPPTDGTAA